MKIRVLYLSLVTIFSLSACGINQKDVSQETSSDTTITSSDLVVGNQEQINLLLTDLNTQLDKMNKKLQKFKDIPKTYTSDNLKNVQVQVKNIEHILSSLEKIAGPEAEYITSETNKHLFNEYQAKADIMTELMDALPTEFYEIKSSN